MRRSVLRLTPRAGGTRRARDPRTPKPSQDNTWPSRLRTASTVASSALTLTLLLDALVGTLSLPRALAWITLAALLFTVLLPPHVTAGDGRLAVRGLLRTQGVRTHHLVSVRIEGAVDRHILLRDAFGGRVTLDPAVLIANPFLWHHLDTGARRSHAAGLLSDRTALRALADAIDGAGTRTLLEHAGLDEPPHAA